MTAIPTLVVVSGPPGAGKTTLARVLARAIGCPAVCRDDVKEGMVHATPGFVGGPGDELMMRAYSTFFDVIDLLLRAGVTTVAEAAFQDALWRPRLEPLQGLARIRVVHCSVTADRAWARRMGRLDDSTRRAHAEPRPADARAEALRHEAFDRLSIDAPVLDVDTGDGYESALDEIVAFVDR